MSNIKPMAVISAVGAGIGGALGFAVAGPAGALVGAKAGGALGVQAAVVNKAEEGVDAVGRQVNRLGNTANAAVERVADVAANAIQNIADVWSKLALAGYALQVGMGTLQQNMALHAQFCTSAFESLNCVSLSLTNISINAGIGIIAIGMGMSVYRMLNTVR
jgi:hypothetical protein